MDNESESLSLHNRISALLKENTDLWATITTLQAALKRAEQGLDASRMDFTFTPATQKAMAARQNAEPTVGALRIARKFLGRDGTAVGAVLENATLGGNGIHIGITDKSDPRVLTVQVP